MGRWSGEGVSLEWKNHALPVHPPSLSSWQPAKPSQAEGHAAVGRSGPHLVHGLHPESRHAVPSFNQVSQFLIFLEAAKMRVPSHFWFPSRLV